MNFSFHPSRFEQEWLPQSLGGFYEDEWFTHVLYPVKGGKEANVYCCDAHPSTGLKFLAAKVYRPRKFRTMRNDAVYREGRQGTIDRRLQRALKKKTRKGRQVETASWIEHEFRTLRVLHEAGADVPKPLALGENAILMEYVGDGQGAAPTLHEVGLGPEEAQRFFGRLVGNLERFLSCDMIHGDLSAYNVLYWEGDFKVIDFPQTVDPLTNANAFPLLVRDVERLCQYFAKYGVESNPTAIVETLWRQYMRREF